MTAHLRSWSETIPELREATGGPAGIERIITRAEHVFRPLATGDLHLEVHAADAADAPTIILVPGTGSHARYHSAALGAFRERGIHAIGLDRPGHGLSGGRRHPAFLRATGRRRVALALHALLAGVLLEFTPQRDWSVVEIPTLVLAGSANRITDEASIRAVMRYAQPPRARLHVIPGTGEIVFHEHLLTTLHLLEPWLTQHLR